MNDYLIVDLPEETNVGTQETMLSSYSQQGYDLVATARVPFPAYTFEDGHFEETGEHFFQLRFYLKRRS